MWTFYEENAIIPKTGLSISNFGCGTNLEVLQDVNVSLCMLTHGLLSVTVFAIDLSSNTGTKEAENSLQQKSAFVVESLVENCYKENNATFKVLSFSSTNFIVAD